MEVKAAIQQTSSPERHKGKPGISNNSLFSQTPLNHKSPAATGPFARHLTLLHKAVTDWACGKGVREYRLLRIGRFLFTGRERRCTRIFVGQNESKAGTMHRPSRLSLTEQQRTSLIKN
ncbi:hypothetical protein [Sphingobium sp. Ant17]|uniref:hypothetical protein n=1 Tax=Sphingobium sp. Ant17 TaxID=1461752 RepID=UPI001268011C|nr:hypothetical protein [Sphingobium sp. Ant17]